MKSGIYKITNLINERVYIGQSIDIRRRFREHFNIQNKDHIKYKTRFYNAVRKYGRENFKTEIIECCQKRFLKKREIYWISFYRKSLGCNNVYNINDGGNGGDNFTNNPNKHLIMLKFKNRKRVVITDEIKKKIQENRTPFSSFSNKKKKLLEIEYLKD